MFIVHVFIHVKADQVEAFKAVSVENARNSLQEPGVARFDLIQQADDPTRFVLVEVYRTPEDGPKHKETFHYNRWRELAEPMLAEPRTRVIYSNVFPAEDGWDSAHAV
jgi:quinol monooxygenase YgiN